MLDPRQKDRSLSSQGSCNYFVRSKETRQFELKVGPCIGDSWVVCEEFANLNPVDLDIDSYPASDIVGGYEHSLNSMSSCAAYCNSKAGTRLVLVTPSSCLCTSSN